MSEESGRGQNESQDERRHDEDAKHHPYEFDHEHGPEGHTREECEHPEHDHHHEK